MPKLSRLPCTNSIGRPTAGRCAARSVCRTSWRMKRIPEKNETGRPVVRDLAAATWVAIRPPIDLPPMNRNRRARFDFAAHRFDDASVARFEQRTAIRNLAASRSMYGKSNVIDVEAACREAGRARDHEGAALTGAGAVREDQRRSGRCPPGRRALRRRPSPAGCAAHLMVSSRSRISAFVFRSFFTDIAGN